MVGFYPSVGQSDGEYVRQVTLLVDTRDKTYSITKDENGFVYYTINYNFTLNENWPKCPSTKKIDLAYNKLKPLLDEYLQANEKSERPIFWAIKEELRILNSSLENK